MKNKQNRIKQILLEVLCTIALTIIMFVPATILATVWIAYANDDITLLIANICTLVNVLSLCTLFVVIKGDE